MSNDIRIEKATKRLKKAHVTLIRNPETCLYAGIVMMGDSYIDETVPTAYTDGRDCVYGLDFVETLSDPELAGLVLHEKLHIVLRHPIRLFGLFKQNGAVCNMAADFAANLLIDELKDKRVKLPPGALLNQRYRGWSVPKIYDDIMKHMPPPPPPPPGGGEGEGQGSGSGKGEKVTIDGKEYEVGSQDEHDFEDMGGMSPEEVAGIERDINDALHQGGILAGRMGAKVPRTIKDLLATKVDWRDALRDFWSNTVSGKDEFSWKNYDMRRYGMGMLLPTSISETIGEVVVAIDTSGSIGSKELSAFASELVSLCAVATPSSVRVLWWDTIVHGEQVFIENYDAIASMLKPLGGGGTHVGSVSDYLVKNDVRPEAVVIFTDGYVEDPIKWNHDAPTLWLLTENDRLKIPSGHTKVKCEKGD
jgi:predicted metal-dependent peptidase